MIEFVEDLNQQNEQQATAPSDTTTIVAEISQSIAEQSQTVSDHSPTIDEPTSDIPQGASFNRENYPLDSRQVLLQLKTAGISRTPRAIQRYCKEGKLDAYFHPTLRTYFVSTASVQKLITTLKEVDERHSDSLFRDTPTRESEHKAKAQDSSQNEREASANLSHESVRPDAVGERVKELENKVAKLEFEKKVVEEVNNHLRIQIQTDRDHFTEKLTRMARLAESFKTRLRLLAAPTQSRGIVDDVSDVEVIEEGVMGHPDEFNDTLKTHDRNK